MIGQKNVFACLSNHSVFRDLAIGSYNSCGNYIDARSNTWSQILDASFFGISFLFFLCVDYFWFQCKVYGVQLGHPWSLPGNPSYRCARSTKQANNQILMKIKSSTRRYCGFDCLGLSINTIWHWIATVLFQVVKRGPKYRGLAAMRRWYAILLWEIFSLIQVEN